MHQTSKRRFFLPVRLRAVRTGKTNGLELTLAATTAASECVCVFVSTGYIELPGEGVMAAAVVVVRRPCVNDAEA